MKSRIWMVCVCCGLLLAAGCDDGDGDSSVDMTSADATGGDATLADTGLDATTPDNDATSEGDATDDDATGVDATEADTTVTTDMAVDMGMDTMMPPGQTGIPPATGEYALTVTFVELGGIQLSFKLDVTTDDATQTITEATLSPVGDDVGAVIATVNDVSADAEGAFALAFPQATLPGAYSPTGSAVDFTVTLTGSVRAGAFCGDVTGTLDSVNNLALNQSTFGTAVWEGIGTEAPGSCDGGGGTECVRMDAASCPTLVVGANTGFESCGVARDFILVAPDTTGDPAGTSYPLVFSWHGLGGNGAGYLSATGFDDQDGAYFIVPDGRGLPGTEYAQTTLDDNEDLAFFDDLVTCATAQLDVDTDRIHTEGMSAGGLYSSYLAVQRPDVLASAAPFSGGLIVDYPMPDPQIPVVISWGGTSDFAVGQNFDTFANDLIDDLVGGGHVTVACDHGEGHTRQAAWSDYALQFLFDHPKGATSPYTAGNLPAVFPSFCSLRQ